MQRIQLTHEIWKYPVRSYWFSACRAILTPVKVLLDALETDGCGGWFSFDTTVLWHGTKLPIVVSAARQICFFDHFKADRAARRKGERTRSGV